MGALSIVKLLIFPIKIKNTLTGVISGGEEEITTRYARCMLRPTNQSSLLLDFLGTTQSHSSSHLFLIKTKNTLTGVISGGEEEIRTLERVTPLQHFQCCAFDHSATSPYLRLEYYTTSLLTCQDKKYIFLTQDCRLNFGINIEYSKNM